MISHQDWMRSRCRLAGDALSAGDVADGVARRVGGEIVELRSVNASGEMRQLPCTACHGTDSWSSPHRRRICAAAIRPRPARSN